MRSQALHSEGSSSDPGIDPGGKSLRTLPAARFGILGVDVRLRTDEPLVSRYFAHAYRWFPPDDRGERLELAALLGPGSPDGPLVRVGERSVSLKGSPSLANHAFLLLLGAIMDAIHDALLVHGAAVSAGGRGIILAGPAFAGKSTLALALMKKGCVFLSDDAAPLHRREGLLMPYPRAVGIRKGGLRSGEVPGEGWLELPHRWLVDPRALGARLPAAPCEPAFLFYLDPGGRSATASEEPPVFEIMLAGDPAPVKEDLAAMGAQVLQDIAPRPFPGVAARFTDGAGAARSLADLQHRHEDRILFLEQRRPAILRRKGPPVAEPTAVSDLLIPMVGDLLNRGRRGRLMEDLKGRVGPLMVELGALLGRTRTFRITSGEPAELAEAIMKIVEDGEV